MAAHGIAYTDNGAPPPEGRIVEWMRDASGGVATWANRDVALEACDRDGWRGYVCAYPSGARPAQPEGDE